MIFRHTKVIFLSLLLFTAVHAQNIDQQPTVSVTGTAEINVVPDCAVFSMSVEKINKDIQIAKTENDKSISQILALAKKYSIDEKNVKTDFINVSKSYEWIGTGADRKRVFLGYEVSKSVTIRLEDLKSFEAFFSDLLNTGLTEIRRVHFESSEFIKHKKDARIQAIQAAKAKADELAKALGQSIGKAVVINENSDARYPTPNITANYIAGIAGDTAAQTAGTFSPGTITIRSQIDVKFILE
ncbi:MAG: SIMPL domain-containing protein [Acidobacteria bacterium]|nr:SIMPL domain-containing protein [Acidobacteriota bacterium]